MKCGVYILVLMDDPDNLYVVPPLPVKDDVWFSQHRSQAGNQLLPQLAKLWVLHESFTRAPDGALMSIGGFGRPLLPSITPYR